MNDPAKLIPLVVLAAVAVWLLFLLRRKPEPPRQPVTAIGATPVELPAKQESRVPAMPTSVPVAPPPVAIRKQRRPPPVVVTPEPTPIDTVLGLLKKPDSLAAAFLLREIFDPPVSHQARR